ncbi:MAG: diacylglycerol kinase family protein [Streptosporangiaceae bacterium]
MGPAAHFIVNGTHASPRLQVACGTLAKRAGWQPCITVTSTASDGVAAASRAVADGAALAVAVGGDGTVRSCAQALAGSGVPLGIVPLGTANLLARALGLPRHPVTALHTAFKGQDRRIDLATADSMTFTAMAGIGIDAAVVAAARLKRNLGWVSYGLSGVAHLASAPAHFTIRVDNQEPLTRTARSIVVANCGLLPGGFTILPDARVDDGMLDVGVLAPHGPFGWVGLASRVLRGDGHLEHFPATRVEITSDKPLPRQADGDILPGPLARTLTVTIQPGSLLVRTPLGSRARRVCGAIP